MYEKLKAEILSLKQNYPGAKWIDIDAEPSDFRGVNPDVFMMIGRCETESVEEFMANYPTLFKAFKAHEARVEAIITKDENAQIDKELYLDKLLSKLDKKPSYRNLKYGKFDLEFTKDSSHNPIIFKKSNYRFKALAKIHCFNNDFEKVTVHALHRNSIGQVVACITVKSTIPSLPNNEKHDVILVCPYGLRSYKSLNEKNNISLWHATVDEAKEAFEKVKNMNFVMFNYVGDRGHRLLIPFYPLV